MRMIWRLVIGLLVFWGMILLYMSTSLYQANGVSDEMELKLQKAMEQLEELKMQNRKLHSLAEELKSQLSPREKREVEDLRNEEKSFVTSHDNFRQQMAFDVDALGNPSLDHEVLRRAAENGVVEMWYFISSQLKHIKKGIESRGGLPTPDHIDYIISVGADHRRSILRDLYNLSSLSSDWRHKEAESLADLVQRRIRYVQNPSDCSKAKKLLCNLNKGCGYGCQLHHVLYCFLVAFGTGRTLILESHGWRYSSGGWEKYFLPVSDTCTDRSGGSTRSWGNNIDDVQVVEMPIVDSLYPRPPYMPQAIPRDLSERLIRLHGHPFVWWLGQFLKYLIRPQPALADDIEATRQRLHFKNPIVGIHIRRTDKIGSEAAYHSLDEYMTYVNDYYRQRDMIRTIGQRRVYLASDDPNVIKEAKDKYPQYEFISDAAFSRAAGLSSRYTDESLRSVIMDIHFLSLCDYLVCTFSSQVCRVAYEIMQTLHPDASQYFRSLDDIYYFGGQSGHSQVAIREHKASSTDELDLKVGDIVGIAGNHWDGFSKGRNFRTGKTGVYPSYKVHEHLDIVDFPTYLNVTKVRS